MTWIKLENGMITDGNRIISSDNIEKELSMMAEAVSNLNKELITVHAQKESLENSISEIEALI